MKKDRPSALQPEPYIKPYPISKDFDGGVIVERTDEDVNQSMSIVMLPN